jgi:thiol-disulfide isomerase/thioredoxin
MKHRRHFWFATGLLLAVGLPGALFVRARLQPTEEVEHVHEGDPKLEADLARLSGAERIERLRQATQDALPAHRLAAAEALANEHSPEGRTLTKELLIDNDSEVRIKAAYALMQTGSKQERPFLRSALRDDDLWLRQEALQWASTNAGRATSKVDNEIVPELIACLNEPSETQRTFAASALAKLVGKPWRYTARSSAQEKNVALKHWKDWWMAEKTHDIAASPLPDIRPRRTDPAPTVSFQTIEGQKISPATDGKVTLLNFWGTWCAPCREEVPSLQKIHQRFAAQGVAIVGIALSEKEGAAGLRVWCQKNNLTYAQALATDDVLEAYGDVHEVPISVLVDKRGRIRYRWQGERDYASFAAMIERLLKD